MRTKAAKREIARFLREANRAIAPYNRARDALMRAEMEADRLGKTDRATRDKLDRLKERVWELGERAEQKIGRLDVHKLLVSLRDA